MRISFMWRVAAAFGLWMVATEIRGHVEEVHRAITVNVAASAVTRSVGYGTFLNMISLDCDEFSATNAMVEGSQREDWTRKDMGAVRVLNHFYDPLTGGGLANLPPDDRWSGPLGRNSFTWASTRNGPGIPGNVLNLECLSNENPLNEWSWQNARDYEWNGLTEPSRENRNAALTNMFRALGQVIHLLEDTSQPQHARNEQHIPVFPCIPDSWHDMVRSPWRSSIEAYGLANVANLNYQHGMLNWRNAGFTKLEDFWDTHLYNGQADALNADANGGVKLGLAEFSNGNFLGDRHLYREYFVPGKVAYYPYPSRNESTNYEQVKMKPELGVETFKLANGTERKGIYIKKTSDGVSVQHHSRMNYLGAKQFSGLTGKPFCTIKDERVLEDYHSILIPKAIEYSAGLLDYFFRGKIETTLVPNPVADGTYDLEIKNVSGDEMKGGTFKLFYDVSGTRTEMVGDDFEIVWTEGTTLAHNDMVTATFKQPASLVDNYTLVYKGTIGTSGEAAADPVDANIAVAAKSIRECGVSSMAWTKSSSLYGGATASATIAGGDGVFSMQTYSGGPEVLNSILELTAPICNSGGDYDLEVAIDLDWTMSLTHPGPVPNSLLRIKIFWDGTQIDNLTWLSSTTMTSFSDVLEKSHALTSGNHTLKIQIESYDTSVTGSISVRPLTPP